MSSANQPSDLIVLVADRNMAATVTAILSRAESLGIRPIRFDVDVHPQKDPGVLRQSQEYLRASVGMYDHALIVFDREGCGKEQKTREELEETVEAALALTGWATDSAVAIVIDPELENWFWSSSPHVEKAVGWTDRDEALRQWLVSRELLQEGEAKPGRPKEAVEAALREMRKPRSSAIYKALAEQVSLRLCEDPAFLKFKQTLQSWFGH